MMQLVVKTLDPEAGGGKAIYAVCITNQCAFARPADKEWEKTASRVETALNALRPWDRQRTIPASVVPVVHTKD